MDDLNELAAVSPDDLHVQGLKSTEAEAIAKAVRAIATTSQTHQQVNSESKRLFSSKRGYCMAMAMAKGMRTGTTAL